MAITAALALSASYGLVACSNDQRIAEFESAPKTTPVAERPPLGWNSFDAYDSRINEEQFRATVDFMSDHLVDKGWEYAVIDYIWWNPEPGAYNTPENYTRRVGHPNVRLDEHGKMTHPELVTMDEFGRLLPAVERFPSAANGAGFKPLADYVHSKGMKFGLHIMRGIHRLAYEKNLPIKGASVTAQQISDPNDQAGWLNNTFGVDARKEGAQAYYDSIFALYASWGVDYVKADDMMGSCGAPFYGYAKGEIEMMHTAIKNSGRDMILSLSCGEAPISQANHLKENATMWRISADFWDRWDDLKRSFELLDKWTPYAGPGHWPDGDMIPFGRISLDNRPHGPERLSNFTETEHYALMSLFSIARSPLIIGSDLLSTPIETIETFFGNEAILAVNQYGENSRQVVRIDDDYAVWISEDSLSDDYYIALFNLSEQTQEVTFEYKHEALEGRFQITELWEGKELGQFSERFSQSLRSHEGRVYRLKSVSSH